MSDHGFEKYVLRDHAPMLGRGPATPPGVVECRCTCGWDAGSERDTVEGELALMDAWGEHCNAHCAPKAVQS